MLIRVKAFLLPGSTIWPKLASAATAHTVRCDLAFLAEQDFAILLTKTRVLRRMKVTPPLAVAPITQEDDMRWNPNPE